MAACPAVPPRIPIYIPESQGFTALTAETPLWKWTLQFVVAFNSVFPFREAYMSPHGLDMFQRRIEFEADSPFINRATEILAGLRELQTLLLPNAKEMWVTEWKSFTTWSDEDAEVHFEEVPRQIRRTRNIIRLPHQGEVTRKSDPDKKNTQKHIEDTPLAAYRTKYDAIVKLYGADQLRGRVAMVVEDLTGPSQGVAE